VLVARRYWRNRSDWEIAVPLVSAAMLLICTMPAHLDSGVRYVLPIFVLLSILAAAGLVTLWTQINQRSMYRAAAIGMFGWLAVSSAWAHPDYLSYFNELGGRDPSRYIVVGDLDWGQDLTRLSVYLRQHSIAHVSIAYDAYFDPAPLGFPETERIQCNARPPSGWVAIDLRRSKVHSECYPWLAGQRPIARVGKTISVYYRQGP